jgi:hypothetical protein
MKRYTWPLLLLFAFASCDNLVKGKNKETDTKQPESSAAERADSETKKQTATKNEPDTNSDADILNNIVVHESGGLQVGQAYLSYEDGRLVPKSNQVGLGETVLLNLVIDKGWEIKNNQASIDATEIIATADGQIVLNARNLFKSKPTVSESDASRIFLKATITKTRADIDYFVVNYRVWDKWGDGEVKGSYNLYIDKDKENQ